MPLSVNSEECLRNRFGYIDLLFESFRSRQVHEDRKGFFLSEMVQIVVRKVLSTLIHVSCADDQFS